MRKAYEAPSLVGRGSFRAVTAGVGRFFNDFLVAKFLI
jgi:hypothetical protein